MDLQTISIVDRSVLGLNKLAIMDIQLYMNDIYILDYYSGVYKFHITKSQALLNQAYYRCQYFTKFSIYSDNLQDQLLLAVAN